MSPLVRKKLKGTTLRLKEWENVKEIEGDHNTNKNWTNCLVSEWKESSCMSTNILDFDVVTSASATSQMTTFFSSPEVRSSINITSDLATYWV